MHARRIALSVLVLVLLVLGGTVSAGVLKGGWSPTPKLALDLEGGTQVILQAKTTDGSAVDSDAMEQARQIMSQRVNAMGVSETEISVQGGTNIVVDVPGSLDQETSDALQQTAALSFRPVLATGEASGSGSSDGGGSDDGSDAGQQAFKGAVSLEDPSKQSTPDASGGSSDGGSDAGGGSGADDGLPYPAWSTEWVTPDLQQTFQTVTCGDSSAQQDAAAEAAPDKPVVVCDQDGTTKYLLGPEVVKGSGIKDASVGQDTNQTGQSTGAYVVNMQFQPDAADANSTMTTALYEGKGATPAFGIMLDGQVISAPQVQAPTSDSASISGNFTQDEAKQLANQLKFGALPLQFDVQSEQQISATLGTDQLEKGMIAGLIGLLLVVAYAVFQYRVLAIVTTSSLAVMGVLAFLTMTVLSHIPDIGYRLSLAGVAGLIVSIAFTADSFIVYFERVRDEIRDGRGIVAAVDHGWNRAKRTILASDTVNLIAAIVLYILSTGSVRGFAFTLGLTTILDLVVVFLFTHPLLQTLVGTRFFGKGHPLSGLDPAMLGRHVPAYAGRGRVRGPAERAGEAPGDDDEDDSVPAHESLAERKARLARQGQQQQAGATNGSADTDESPDVQGSRPVRGTTDDGGEAPTQEEER
jgi:preprotein translocase subunit SecD